AQEHPGSEQNFGPAVFGTKSRSLLNHRKSAEFLVERLIVEEHRSLGKMNHAGTRSKYRLSGTREAAEPDEAGEEQHARMPHKNPLPKNVSSSKGCQQRKCKFMPRPSESSSS